jgi:hypothetical protein
LAANRLHRGQGRSYCPLFSVPIEQATRRNDFEFHQCTAMRSTTLEKGLDGIRRQPLLCKPRQCLFYRGAARRSPVYATLQPTPL